METPLSFSPTCDIVHDDDGTDDVAGQGSSSAATFKESKVREEELFSGAKASTLSGDSILARVLADADEESDLEEERSRRSDAARGLEAAPFLGAKQASTLFGDSLLARALADADEEGERSGG